MRPPAPGPLPDASAGTALTASGGRWGALPSRLDLGAFPPVLATLAIALLLAVLLSPAVMSTDSILQYEQALSGRFDDWHPPLLAIVLSGFLAAGPGLGALVLCQCVAAVFGVRALSLAALRLLFADRLAKRTRAWIPVAVLAVLLLPVTAWPFFFMTFWTDVWVAVGLLWVAALSMSLFLRQRIEARGTSAPGWILVVGLMGVTAIVRHNALPLVVPFGLLAAGLAPSSWKRPAAGRLLRWGTLAALALAPALTALGVERGLARRFDVRHESVGNLVMALDLVGVCVVDRPVCAELPVTRGQLPGDAWARTYRFGEIEPLTREDPPVVAPGLLSTAPNPQLAAEYRRTVARHPLLWLEVKLRAFVRLLGLRETVYYFPSVNDPNDLGLTLDERWEGLRGRWADLAWRSAQHGFWRWLAAVHAVWIAAAGLGLALTALRWRRSRETRWLLLAGVLLLPLAYYASYLVAVVALDYRYMAPATLLVQVLALSAGAGALASRRGR